MKKPDLNIGIRYLKGVGERRAESFARLGIYTVFDLLNYFPREYEDRRRLVPIADVRAGESVCIDALVASSVSPRDIRRGFSVTKIRVADESGGMNVVFFNQKYSVKQLACGERYVFFGKVEEQNGILTMVNPSFEKTCDMGKKTGSILPVYRLTAGISQEMLRAHMRTALLEFSEWVPEIIPDDIRMRESLAHVGYSYRQIHFPSSIDEAEIAKRRLVFEEFFVLSLGLMRLRSRREVEEGVAFLDTDTDEFYKALPFSPTNAQRRVINEAASDMGKKRPMNRIIQGDVGSGKTAVAAACAYLAYKNGFQTALMVPTEILAEQHFNSLAPLFEKLGMNVALLCGGMRVAQKRDVKALIESGKANVVIGTHALISDDVSFSSLGLVIADEQHRFGVRQRASLAAKGAFPHQLVMSATPIPRSLALIMYGDLDISIIDELPPGRLPVSTLIVNNSKRNDAYEFVRAQMDEGRQAYIVCPMIDEDEEGELRSVEKFAEELSATVFRGKKVEFLHGRKKSKEKDAIMQRFVTGELDAIVSTTVIEVGVNVPNATVMAIENAERFGLSQLHQLRGRVGRGEHKSYCILFSNVPKASPAAERLSALRATNDGFKISEEDLKLRGPGDFFGTRQHGLPELKIASLAEDMRVLDHARCAAKEVLSSDCELTSIENKALRERVLSMFDKSTGNSFN